MILERASSLFSRSGLARFRFCSGSVTGRNKCGVLFTMKETDVKTKNLGTNLPMDFDSFNSPDHETWKAHRQLLTHLRDSEAGYRGCFGLAMLINSHNIDSWLQVKEGPGTNDSSLVFVPDSTIAWASLVDIPVGNFRFQDTFSREVHWATVRKTTTQFGVPSLTRGSEDKMAWDFRSFPFGKARQLSEDGKSYKVFTPGADALNTAHYPQLFKVFNALEWAMTTTAFSYRSSWAEARPALFQSLGFEYEQDKKVMVFGNRVYDTAARPNMWMPRAYLAFPEQMKDKLYDRATRPGGAMTPDVEPHYTEGMKEAFMNAMGVNFEFRAHFDGRVASMERMYYQGVPVVSVLLKGDQGERHVVRFFRDTAVLRKRVRDTFKAGEIIGEEKLDAPVPEDWYTIPYFKRWDRHAARILHPRRLDPVMRLWFERQAYSLQPGYVHFPAQIASVAALGAAVDDRLFWEVSQSLEYYRDDADAIVFPTVQMRAWYDLSGSLPGDVLYDLNPADPRYETYFEMQQRLAQQPKTPKKKKMPLPKLPAILVDTVVIDTIYIPQPEPEPELTVTVETITSPEVKAAAEKVGRTRQEAEDAIADELAMMKAFASKKKPPEPIDDNLGINLSPKQQEEIRVEAIVGKPKKAKRGPKPKKEKKGKKK